MKVLKTISVGTNPEVEPLFISRINPAKFREISGKTPLKQANLLHDTYGAGDGI